MFKPVDPNPDFPQIEESILSFWKENKTFEKSISLRPEDKPWTFLDGPPFVTGMPHYGSLLSSLPKDLFGRYWTMKGYRVRRVWGWDGHGLPIENKVENELQIKRKKDIEEVVGVKTFIEHCQKYVNDVSAEWEWYVDHIGRWVDFKHAYRTWDTDYMESVMWVFKQMYDKGHIYKGLRVSLYCPHCATPISNFEVAMDAENYKDITESATTYKYKMKGEDSTYFLAWSTTPWTKIATTALAVNPKLDYVKIQSDTEFYILAESTLEKQSLADFSIIAKYKGSDLVDKEFELHYPYFTIESGKRAGVIVPADYVTSDEGTGVVTLAAYGAEDLEVMNRENIQIVLHLDEEGTVKSDVPLFAGMYFLKSNKAVNADLAERGLVLHDEPIVHSVAHCWRCATQLYHSPQNAWYVDVQTLKPQLFKNNEQINWYPEHFKKGRFQKSMESAPDWNISRNRYWGSPVPVWECACGERFVPGSIQELQQASGQNVHSLHKPEIDEVVVKCKKCGKDARRTPEVLDSWIEAGSASFAERHFPFETNENTNLDPRLREDDRVKRGSAPSFFPPDFVAEYTGQIRAWFYVLHVIGTALYDSPAFKNVIVEGVILGSDGRKMSKNFKNYPDPKEMLERYGGDALRLYMMGSPVMRGEDILISEDAYRGQVRSVLLTLWNCYKYFTMNVGDWIPGSSPRMTASNAAPQREENVLDQWIVSLLHKLIQDVTEGLDGYDTVGPIQAISSFIQDFSTWYIRRSRDRLALQIGGSGEESEDSLACLQTMHTVLVTLSRLLAPVAPFISEEMFKNLTDEESVHLTDWPTSDPSRIDDQLMREMEVARELVEKAHSVRKEQGIKVRQPLASLTSITQIPLSSPISQIVSEELNVKTHTNTTGSELSATFDLTITSELQAEGEARELIRKIQDERKKMGLSADDTIKLTLPSIPEGFKDLILKKVNAKSIEVGDSFLISL